MNLLRQQQQGRFLRVAASSNQSVNRTACKLGLQVPSALRAPAAGYLKRLGVMRSIGSIPGVLLLASIVGRAACSETSDTTYKSYAEAVAAGAVSAGWVPNWPPEQASDILEVHNIDTNSVMLRFNYPKTVQVRLPANCSRVAMAKITSPPFERSWWPADVPERNSNAPKHEYWRCANQYVAILANRQQGLVWSPE